MTSLRDKIREEAEKVEASQEVESNEKEVEVKVIKKRRLNK